MRLDFFVPLPGPVLAGVAHELTMRLFESGQEMSTGDVVWVMINGMARVWSGEPEEKAGAIASKGMAVGNAPHVPLVSLTQHYLHDRALTCVSATCEVVGVRIDAYQAALETALADQLLVTRRIGLLRRWNRDELLQFTAGLEHVEVVGRGRTIFREHQEATDAYIVAKGSVLIERERPRGQGVRGRWLFRNRVLRRGVPVAHDVPLIDRNKEHHFVVRVHYLPGQVNCRCSVSGGFDGNTFWTATGGADTVTLIVSPHHQKVKYGASSPLQLVVSAEYDLNYEVELVLLPGTRASRSHKAVVRLATIGPGEFVGLRAIINSTPFTYTAMSDTSTVRLYRAPRALILLMCRGDMLAEMQRVLDDRERARTRTGDSAGLESRRTTQRWAPPKQKRPSMAASLLARVQPHKPPLADVSLSRAGASCDSSMGKARAAAVLQTRKKRQLHAERTVEHSAPQAVVAVKHTAEGIAGVEDVVERTVELIMPQSSSHVVLAPPTPPTIVVSKHDAAGFSDDDDHDVDNSVFLTETEQEQQQRQPLVVVVVEKKRQPEHKTPLSIETTTTRTRTRKKKKVKKKQARTTTRALVVKTAPPKKKKKMKKKNSKMSMERVERLVRSAETTHKRSVAAAAFKAALKL